MLLLSNAFVDFLQGYLTYIVLGVSALVLLVIAIIIAIAVKKSKKPLTYVSDEIDRTVDQAAKQKAELSLKANNRDEAKGQSEDEQNASSPATYQEQKAFAADEQEPTQCIEQCDCSSTELTQQGQAHTSTEPTAQTDKAVECTATELTQQVQAHTSTEPTAQTDKAVECTATELTQQGQAHSSTEPTAQTQAQDEQSAEQARPDDDLVQGADTQNDETDTESRRRPVSYRVVYDSETRTWEVRKDNAKRVTRRVHTKKEALEIAEKLSQNQDLNLVVHKKDGKFQKRR